MFSPRASAGSARRPTSRAAGRKSLAGTPTGLFSPVRRASLPARATPTRAQYTATAENFDLQGFGSSLPVKVMEALTMAEEEEEISTRVDQSGWAWLVCGESLIIWKIGQTAVAKLSVCKELQLPPSDFAGSADLVALSCQGSGEGAPVQAIAVMAVTREGTVRYWPSLVHEGTYTETVADLGGNLCSFLTAVKVASHLTSTLQFFPASHWSMLKGNCIPDFSDRLHQILITGGVAEVKGQPLKTIRNRFEKIPCFDHRGLVQDGDNSTGRQNQASENGFSAFLPVSLQQTLVHVALFPTPEVNFCLSTSTSSKVRELQPLCVDVHELFPFLSSNTAALLVEPGPGRTSGLGNSESGVFSREPTSAVIDADMHPDTRHCCPTPTLKHTSIAVWNVSAAENLHLALFHAFQSFILPSLLELLIKALLATTLVASCMKSMQSADRKARHMVGRPLLGSVLELHRKDLMQAQNMVDEIFPPDGDPDSNTELDQVVTQIDLDLIDDYPAMDPRWAESVPDAETSGFSLTSLILLHQLEDKMKAHCFFMNFLLEVSCISFFLVVGSEVQPSTCRIRSHENKHFRANARLHKCLSPSSHSAGAEKHTVERWPCTTADLEEGFCSCSDMLLAAGQYRETKVSLYKPPGYETIEPEYIPWTASSAPGGVRAVIVRQHEVILKTVYPQADTELRNTLNEQLVALLDSYLDGYVTQLKSLNRPSDPERYNNLEMEYTQRRSELLSPL
uniref:Nucleoporin 133 n=1 Tax=Lepisosteus oculatus TaxID=7918 RepID=W5NEH8_LEPOC